MPNGKWNRKKVLQAMEKDIRRKLTAVGEFGVGVAKIHAPVDTGNLRSSIDYKVKGKSVWIGTNVEYAPWIEFGTGEFAESGKGRQGGWFFTDKKGKTFFTRGNKPQPFLRPVINNHQKQIFKIMAL